MSKEKSDAKGNRIGGVIKKLLVGLVIYAVLCVAFYFLAGDQLHLRPTRSALTMLPGEAPTIELFQGETVEQSFSGRIQRLESVSIMWSNYERQDTNRGTLTVELIRESDREVLMSGGFEIAGLWNGQVLTLQADTPIETVWGAKLILRLHADSPKDFAGTPIMCLSQGPTEMGAMEDTLETFSLSFDGEDAEGTLCFAADGTDYIWLGLHYWKIVTAFGAILTLIALIVVYRARKGRRSYIVNALIALEKYKFLIRQLVSRDFKTKYKRSILGVFWSFLNPLLTMLVQYYVFSTIFRPDIPNFAAYLIIGTVMFSFFSESVGLALTSILGNAGLITKVYMPKYIYPLTRVLSSMVNLAISWLPMVIVCLITGVHFRKAAILALFFMLCLVVFCLGMGLLLSTSMVFFRDTQFLWSVLNMMWMYATPIFYPEKILPDNLRVILNFNPMYHFIRNVRLCILDGISPEPICYIQCMLFALGMLVIGAIIFKKEQDKFVLYL